MEKQNKIYIQNESEDLMSSFLLDELIRSLQRKYRIDDKDIHREYLSRENIKCELTFAVSVLTSIATGLISAAIWDYIKAVYARRGRDNLDKEWRLSVNIDRPLRVVVKENKNTNNIDIEISEFGD